MVSLVDKEPVPSGVSEVMWEINKIIDLMSTKPIATLHSAVTNNNLMTRVCKASIPDDLICTADTITDAMNADHIVSPHPL